MTCLGCSLFVGLPSFLRVASAASHGTSDLLFCRHELHDGFNQPTQCLPAFSRRYQVLAVGFAFDYRVPQFRVYKGYIGVRIGVMLG